MTYKEAAAIIGELIEKYMPPEYRCGIDTNSKEGKTTEALEIALKAINDIETVETITGAGFRIRNLVCIAERMKAEAITAELLESASYNFERGYHEATMRMDQALEEYRRFGLGGLPKEAEKAETITQAERRWEEKQAAATADYNKKILEMMTEKTDKSVDS